MLCTPSQEAMATVTASGEQVLIAEGFGTSRILTIGRSWRLRGSSATFRSHKKNNRRGVNRLSLCMMPDIR
jgi:hypothetical protein